MIKIGVIGLDNAGKTSIVKSLIREFEAISNLQPTQLIERSNISTGFNSDEIIIWDYGGQLSYREKYLNEAQRNFSQIDYLFYVIDVQSEKERLKASIAFFCEIIPNLAEYSPDSKIILLFHKFDPNYSGQIELNKTRSEFIKSIYLTIKKYNREFTIFHTSIFSPMTIITAFSQSLLLDSSIYNEISDILSRFCNENKIEFAVIFTEDFFELGHYISSSLEIRRKDELISDIITEMDVDGILKEQIIIETNSTPLVFNLNIAYIMNNSKIEALKDAIRVLKNEFQSLLVDSYLFQIKEYAI